LTPEQNIFLINIQKTDKQHILLRSRIDQIIRFSKRIEHPCCFDFIEIVNSVQTC